MHRIQKQIIAVLREYEAGAKTGELARKHGISEATLYNWKAKYGGMEVQILTVAGSKASDVCLSRDHAGS